MKILKSHETLAISCFEEFFFYIHFGRGDRLKTECSLKIRSIEETGFAGLKPANCPGPTGPIRRPPDPIFRATS